VLEQKKVFMAEKEFITERLIVLYVMDKMEVPLEEEVLLTVCATDNKWISYMDLKALLPIMHETGFLHRKVTANKFIYHITAEGRQCIANYYTKIPLSQREEMTDVIKKKRLDYRKKQELFSDYQRNSDGTYKVVLKILEPDSQKAMLEIILMVDGKANAKYAYSNWEENASKIYEMLYDNLCDS
jgi:hypothetical protein